MDRKTLLHDCLEITTIQQLHNAKLDIKILDPNNTMID